MSPIGYHYYLNSRLDNPHADPNSAASDSGRSARLSAERERDTSLGLLLMTAATAVPVLLTVLVLLVFKG